MRVFLQQKGSRPVLYDDEEKEDEEPEDTEPEIKVCIGVNSKYF